MRYESLFERAAAPELFPRTRVHKKKLACRAESLLECAAMLAAMKKFALVMMMMALPLQGLAAVFISVCQNDPTHGSSAVKSYHQHAASPAAPEFSRRSMRRCAQGNHASRNSGNEDCNEPLISNVLVYFKPENEPDQNAGTGVERRLSWRLCNVLRGRRLRQRRNPDQGTHRPGSQVDKKRTRRRAGAGGGAKTAARAAQRGFRGANRAAQQPRTAGDLRRTRHRRSRPGAGRPAAQPRPLP